MSSATDTAKIFTTGRSQAVRLPKAYRFDTAEVFIEKVGNTVILRPKQDESIAWGTRLQRDGDTKAEDEKPAWNRKRVSEKSGRI